MVKLQHQQHENNTKPRGSVSIYQRLCTNTDSRFISPHGLIKSLPRPFPTARVKLPIDAAEKKSKGRKRLHKLWSAIREWRRRYSMYKSIIQNKARRVKGRATTRIERDKRFCDKCKVSLHLTRYVLREGHLVTSTKADKGGSCP